MRARGAAAISRASPLLAAALVCLATLTQLGCGGGGDGASTAHRDSGGGAAQFEVRGGDNSLQRYGSEAAPEEFEQAAAALRGFLGARAEHDWAAACRYLGAQIKREIARPGLAGSCPSSLAALTRPGSSAALREAAVVDAGSLRVEGARGFLLFRGAPDATAYAIAMSKERGEWKVGMMAPIALG